jgi:TPP-dependent pyruvate/acetoin dehydrogenase alpha subunit
VRERLRADDVSEEDLDAINGEVGARVSAAVEFALNSREPRADRLAAGMHTKGSAAQFARMRPGSAFGEEGLSFDAGLGA